MPVTPTYPGVYITEVPSGVRTITGVATSITAFIGRALRGPVNEPKTINSPGDYERIFGGMWVHSPMSFAIGDFYQNGGSQAIVVRLFHPYYASEAERDDALVAARAVIADISLLKIKDVPTDTTINKFFFETAKTYIASNYSTSGTPENEAANIILDAINECDDSSLRKDIIDAANDAIATLTTKASLLLGGTLKLEAASEGSWGNSLEARVDHNFKGTVTDLFNLTVRDGTTGQEEEIRRVSVDPDHPRYVEKVLENQSGLVRMRGNPPALIPAETLDSDSEPDWMEVDPVDKASDGIVLELADYTGSTLNKTGIYALEKTDLFNLLCIPPYSLTMDVEAALWNKASVYCMKRRAFLLVDPPKIWMSKDSAKSNLGSVAETNKNAAIFFPRLRKPNPLKDGQLDDFAPCGAVAGVFARTDSNRGVWKAPAGLDATLRGVPQLSVPLTDAENGELNPLGINCLRSKTPVGRIIWGSRTLEGDDRLASEWKYIPIRRLALMIEESLFRGTQWVVFEPNDEPLWAQIRLNLSAFMHGLFRKGAFEGSAPADAYFVKCDSETTTPADQNLGIVNIVVGFAPLKPAEFVIIKIQQMSKLAA